MVLLSQFKMTEENYLSSLMIMDYQERKWRHFYFDGVSGPGPCGGRV